MTTTLHSPLNFSEKDSESQRANSSIKMGTFLLGVTLPEVDNDAAQIATRDAAAGLTDAEVQPSVVDDGASAVAPARSNATEAEAEAKYSNRHSSFRANDKFFHCMLSYRVNSEGPYESEVKCGNDLALLVRQSCSRCNSSKPPNQVVDLNNDVATKTMRQSLESTAKFGKWPPYFPNPTSPIRMFLDQKNLRSGVDWKGSGKLKDGGFLGALSSSLMIVPLLSATPVRFKIESCGEKDRYKFSSPTNMTIPGEKGSLELFCDGVAVATGHAASMYACKDFCSSGGDISFSLKLRSVSGDITDQTKTVENLLDVWFWTPNYFLPSDGSGPRGSVSEMLTIMQKPEALIFCIVEEPSPEFVVLEVQLSDHVFFKNENILLHLERESQPQDFKIESVEVQGSVSGCVKSRLRVRCGESPHLLLANETYEGRTVAADRIDNVLMEFMLTRALHLVFADETRPHPCKLIYPVFVDDLDVIFTVSQRLSTEVSDATVTAVKDSLQKILQRSISEDEDKKWIRVSVKDAVLFIAKLQGLRLSVREHRSKTMDAKAELVCSGIISTIGIEAELHSLEQYVADNPLAHELLDFINQEDIGHIGPALIKSDVTSLKIFSQLSSESIKLITQDSREVSKRPLVREIADIESAVQAAKLSPYVLPVSKRLATFEDKDASFMTTVYSTFAMEQALAKPFFGLMFMSLIAIVFSCISVYQFLSGELGNAIINLVRGLGFGLTWICINVFNSIRSARKVLLFTFTLTGLASIAAVVVVDKFVNGRIVWDYSRSCSQYLNSEIKRQYGTCIAYQFSYNSWQAFLFLLVGAFVLWKQEWVWRLLCFGCSILAFINLIFQILLQSEGPFDYFIVLSITAVLIVTEALKYYGTLQAIQLIQTTKENLNGIWKNISKEEKEHLQSLAECVQRECEQSPAVLDRSKNLGKWGTPSQHTTCFLPFRCASRSAEPPQIHQETSDFDELYRRAACLNDTFQLWIESFFNELTQTSGYVYQMPHHADQFIKNRLKGETIRGPVKRPDRAIAKVYRSYSGDVTLLTDLVRCAVRFETCKDMLDFVKNWLFVYGKPKCPDAKETLLTRWKEELFQTLGSLIKSNDPSYSALSASENAASTVPQPHVSVPVDSPSPIFEILRIRNRLHPELQDVPGGYRDFALKVNIGFFRDTASQRVQIVPLQFWGNKNIRIKFLVVEIQLLLDKFKGSGEMHQSYVEMRNKLAN